LADASAAATMPMIAILEDATYGYTAYKLSNSIETSLEISAIEKEKIQKENDKGEKNE